MNTNHTQETTDNSSSPAFDRKAVDTLTQSLVELGTEWAVLGISFGTQALERSAKSLSLAAKTLSTISRALEKKMDARENGEDENAEEIVVAAEPIEETEASHVD